MEQEKREELIRAGQMLKEQLAEYEENLRDLENALQFEAQRLPNLTHAGAAIGGEENAIVLQEVGEKKKLGFEVCCTGNCALSHNSHCIPSRPCPGNA
jgi:seryl-tRNA synthetase